MNSLHQLLIAVLILGTSACADLDELLENPNAVTPDRANAAALYNSAQIEFNDVQNDPFFFTSGLVRMTAETGGFVYQETHSPSEFDDMWQDFYAQFLPDADAFIVLGEATGEEAAAASMKIMKAYLLMQFVDLFNDVPYSEANLGASDDRILNPVDDDAADVYAAAVDLLDEALIQLEDADNFADLRFDNFYGGTADDWAALARTLKLRAAVTTRLVNPVDVGSIVASGDLIDENSENFEYKYGNNRINPDNRHPLYADSYEENDGAYLSNWLMWLMTESKDIVDPRTRYYFFRQATNVFPAIVNRDPNAFDCIFTDLPTQDLMPAHYEAISDDMPYCLGSYELSYFGRDHLNGSGVPPDGQYRTVFGLYPAGGRFDDGFSNELVQNLGTDGARGEGIEPIWQASFTHFILAESALTGNYNDGDAKALLRKGIELSMERVRASESLVNTGEVVATVPQTVTVGNTFPTDSTFAEYVDYVMEEYDAASAEDRLGIVAREYFIALWGNGLEAYNLYRRTCLPADLQPGIDPNYGEFIRSALYPFVHVNRNQNATQKSGITVPVFWDTNDASCNY